MDQLEINPNHFLNDDDSEVGTAGYGWPKEVRENNNWEAISSTIQSRTEKK
jgi:hypothetical protein